MSNRESEAVLAPARPPAGLRPHVELIRGVGPDRERCERELLASGAVLPLPHRCEWARSQPAADSWFLAIRDSGGAALGGFGLAVTRSRALPGHALLRVERFGAGLSPEVREAGLASLSNLARRGWVLRVNVEVFARESEGRAALAATLCGFGFVPVRPGRNYSDTLAVDLTPEEPRILASFQELARRNIRKIAKFPVEVRPVTDPVFAPRIDALLKETFDRTGGVHRPQDWVSRIALSNRAPEWSRVVGMFRTDASGPESLLSFAWGCNHGDHAHYESGGSTRSAETGLPLSYAPMWDLIRWARRNGAKWFDLGGVTRGHDGDPNDPLGGISDFKRYFSRDLVRVGEELVLEPHPLRARVAHAVSSGAAWVSGLKQWWKRGRNRPA